MKHVILPALLFLAVITTPSSGLTDDHKKKPERKPSASEERKKEAPRERDPSPREAHRKVAPKLPFLGVATTSVPESLRAHLDLPDGFGLQIFEVVEDSPASKAGLAKHDVLVKLDDQRLISPEHLSLLVRSMKSGDEMTLTLIRKGAEKKVEVTLGEADGLRLSSRMGHGRLGHFEHGAHPKTHEEWQNYMKEQQDRFQRDWFSPRRPVSPRDHEGREHDEAKPRGERDSNASAESPGRNEEPSGRPPAVSVSPGFPINVFGTEGILKIDNEYGEVTITQKDGQHRIRILDDESGLVHEGDYDPAEGTEALPDEAQEQLEIMKLDNLKVLSPPGEPKPRKTSDREGLNTEDEDEDDSIL